MVGANARTFVKSYARAQSIVDNRSEKCDNETVK